MNLDRVGADLLRHLAGEQLRHRGFLETRPARVFQRGGAKNHQFRRVDPRRHVGEFEGDRLVLEDRLAELLALFRVIARRLVGRPRHADRLRGDADAPALEIGERDLQAHAFRAEPIGDGHAHVLEDEGAGVGGMLAELQLHPLDAEAGRIRRHDEGRQPGLPLVGIGHREDDRDLRVLPRGDELLGAVDDVMIALAPRARADRGGVGARVRLGQAEAADPLAARHGLQIFLTLRVVAVIQDRHAADAVMHAHDGRDGATTGRDLDDRSGIGDIIEPRAVPFAGHVHAHESKRRHLGNGLCGKAMLPIPLRCERRELFA